MDCGIIYPSFVMDFDHVRGTKEFRIGASSANPGIKRLKAEIEKCDLVCSNCHRIRTFERIEHQNYVEQSSPKKQSKELG